MVRVFGARVGLMGHLHEWGMAASKVCLTSGIFSKSVSKENGVLSRPQGRALRVKISATGRKPGWASTVIGLGTSAAVRCSGFVWVQPEQFGQLNWWLGFPLD